MITDNIDWNLHWQMSNADRLAISGILSRIKPGLSEVGCYKGGSLQVISHYSEKVYSLDIDPGVVSLGDQFDNRISYWIVSRDAARVVNQLNRACQPVEFVLIDGDHSSKGNTC